MERSSWWNPKNFGFYPRKGRLKVLWMVTVCTTHIQNTRMSCKNIILHSFIILKGWRILGPQIITNIVNRDVNCLLKSKNIDSHQLNPHLRPLWNYVSQIGAYKVAEQSVPSMHNLWSRNEPLVFNEGENSYFGMYFKLALLILAIVCGH